MRRWQLHQRNDLALEEIAQWTRPVLLAGFVTTGAFIPRRCIARCAHWMISWCAGRNANTNDSAAIQMRAWDWLQRVRARQPNLFAHWGAGVNGWTIGAG